VLVWALSSIDISIYPLLGKLNCASNNLSSIDFSANPNLGNFICNNNNLTALDFSANLSIYYLDCSDNALTSLSVKNGAFTTYDGFDATNNPALTCIEVDDVAYFNTTWIAGKRCWGHHITLYALHVL
jgi:Leucine-rich repeat (LRR) protein